MGFFDFFKRQTQPAAADIIVQAAIQTAISVYLPKEYQTIIQAIQLGDVAELQRFLVIFGQAFGVHGARHWIELTENERTLLLDACPIFRERHKNYLIFKNIPRWASVWIGDLPPMIDGNTASRQPIPKPGEWFVQEGGIACQTEGDVQFRIGWIWNDVETKKWNAAGGRGNIFTLSVAVK